MTRTGLILTDKDIDMKSVGIRFICVIRVPFHNSSVFGWVSTGNGLG